MPLTVYTIADLRSFRKTTNEPRQVAGIYFFSILDGLVELAYAVSKDFFKRPHLYTESDASSLAEIVARLRAKAGNDEKVPSKTQREQIYTPLFGPGHNGEPDSNEVNFPRLRDDLVRAASAFAERVFDTGEAMLRERVRAAHRPLKEYLEGLLGASVRWSRDEALGGITEGLAYTILRERAITAVFGTSSPPTRDWPYTSDANGDKLVEEISRQLPPAMNSAPPLNRERFSNLQRVALAGAEALATIIDASSDAIGDADLNVLITKVYTWGAALADTQAVLAPAAELPSATTPAAGQLVDSRFQPAATAAPSP